MITRTKRQREILTFVSEFMEEHGYQPSYQQIANHFGVKSKGGIAKHIEALEKKGLVSRNRENGSFTLEINPEESVGDLVCEVEWLISPDSNEESFQANRLYVPKFMLGLLSPADTKALLVSDNSLKDESICQDDVVLIESKTFARDGEIISALIEENEIVLRKFYRKGANIELVPANENYDPIIKAADRVMISGIFRGLLRPST